MQTLFGLIRKAPLKAFLEVLIAYDVFMETYIEFSINFHGISLFNGGCVTIVCGCCIKFYIFINTKEYFE